MTGFDVLRNAGGAIFFHRLRSFLTMLGILIGIASVILLTSIGEGTRTFILGQFTQFGTNIIAINPGKSQTSGIPGSLGATIRRPSTWTRLPPPNRISARCARPAGTPSRRG